MSCFMSCFCREICRGNVVLVYVIMGIVESVSRDKKALQEGSAFCMSERRSEDV